MAYAALSCPSCGAKEVLRRDAGFVCSFCGTRVVPRLDPGALCDDGGEAGFCPHPAVSPCRACARPLCDRHDAPKRIYWNEPLTWQALCPGWGPQDAVEWGRLTAPTQGFPVADFTPFEWVPHERRCLYAVGRLEEEITAVVGPVVRKAGGSIKDAACLLEALCSACEREMVSEVHGMVAGFASRYAKLAVRDRLDALRADAEQTVRYVEAFLGRHLATKIPAEAAEPDALGTDSPRSEWDLWGRRFAERIEALDRLRSRLGTATKSERRSGSPA